MFDDEFYIININKSDIDECNLKVNNGLKKIHYVFIIMFIFIFICFLIQVLNL